MKKVVFVGQAMPRIKRDPHDWPSLNKWLFSIGLTEDQIKDNFFYTALVDYFPGSFKGSHLVPTKNQIEKELQRLKNALLEFSPDIVVPIGRLSISYCLGKSVSVLESHVGCIYRMNPYSFFKSDLIVIPLPHPSGASTWKHQPKNKKLLFRALSILKKEIIK